MREVRMTFGEHLEELRLRIIRSLIWLTLTTSFCLFFGDALMNLSERPHRDAVRGAMQKRHIQLLEKNVQRLEPLMTGPERWEPLFSEQILEELARSHSREALTDVVEKQVSRRFPYLSQDESSEVKEFVLDIGGTIATAVMDLISTEIRPPEGQGYPERFQRLEQDLRKAAQDTKTSGFQEWLGIGSGIDHVIGQIARFNTFLKQRRKAILESPPPSLAELRKIVTEGQALKEVSEIYDELKSRVEMLLGGEPPKLKLLKYPEGFMSYMKVSLIFGLFFALPLILYEIWKFVGAGLYEREQRQVLTFLPFSIALFVVGATFGFLWMVPFGLQFLASWGTEFAELNFSLESYINLFFTLTVLLGLVFQTPLVMIFLYKIGLVTSAGFAAARKYTLLGAVVFSTLVTPPDPVSWSLMAGPIMCLYEMGIRICRFLDRRKKTPKIKPEVTVPS